MNLKAGILIKEMESACFFNSTITRDKCRRQESIV